MPNDKIGFLQRSHWLKLLLELIAVFVGITAGFFFENFREERANRIQERKFLSSLYSNVKSDSSEIRDYLNGFKENLEIAGRTLTIMDSTRVEIDSALALLGILGYYSDLLLQEATYESIVNSGKLDLITDYSIRNDILSYYQNVRFVQNVDQVYNNYIDNFVMPYLFEQLDFLTGEVSDQFDPNGKDFRNVSIAYYTMVDAKVDLAGKLDSLNHQLLTSLMPYTQ